MFRDMPSAPEDSLPSAQSILGERRLVLVSNREPYTRERTAEGELVFQRTTGGLVSALDPVMRSCGGTWVAWDPGGDPESELRYQVPGQQPRFTLRRVPLTSSEVHRYYFGFANRALWPLCHYFVDRCHFDLAEWRDYVTVNRRFAEAVADEAGDDDIIWVHDYHFCLLPQMIRERRTRSTIAFFLHIPFPAEELFRILPWRSQILEGLLGADLVGFHTQSYAQEFMRSCERILGAEVDHEACLVHYRGREIRIAPFPIGIDVDEFESLARREDIAERAGRLRGNLAAEKVILGVDRLDYSKGITERLHAIEYLFENYPQHRGRAVFVQVAVPSRTRVEEYRQLKRQIDEMVGRINGRFGDAGWQPIRYLARGVPRPELVSYYRASDIALITPIRDGMNLVAKEYVASRTDDDGVLVLSEFTGAAEELGEGSLMCNPFSIEETAAVIDRALRLDSEERRRRMSQLREAVRKTEINRWLHDVLVEALGIHERNLAKTGEGGPAKLE